MKFNCGCVKPTEAPLPPLPPSNATVPPEECNCDNKTCSAENTPNMYRNDAEDCNYVYNYNS